MIVDDLNNPNNQTQGVFYQLTTNENNTEYTLQEFGKPINEDEQIVFVFSAKNWTNAMQIKHQFLEFEPYKPMPENTIISQSYQFKDEHGVEHEILATIYQPQQFGEMWQCDYQLAGYGKTQYETSCSTNGFNVIELAMTTIKERLQQFEINYPNLMRV